MYIRNIKMKMDFYICNIVNSNHLDSVRIYNEISINILILILKIVYLNEYYKHKLLKNNFII